MTHKLMNFSKKKSIFTILDQIYWQSIHTISMEVRDDSTHLERISSCFEITHPISTVIRDDPTQIEMEHVWTTRENPMGVFDGPTHIERVYSDSKTHSLGSMGVRDGPIYIGLAHLDYKLTDSISIGDKDGPVRIEMKDFYFLISTPNSTGALDGPTHVEMTHS